MVYSLRLKILLSMVVVILITVGLIAFMSHRVANAEIERAQVREDNRRDHRLSVMVARRYAERRSWFDAQPVVESAGAIYGRRVLLTDREGVVVADTNNTMQGRRLDGRRRDRKVVPVVGPEGQLGALVVSPESPGPPEAPLGPALEPTGPSLNMLLVMSGLLATGVAVGLTFFLSRRVVAPVESLAQAAQRVARRDFTARAPSKSSDEVGELARRFNDMVGELARTEEVRRNMVADLAHELRTPLTNISAYLEGISDGVIEPNSEVWDLMQGETALLTRLIEELQDLALAESGRLQLQVEDCDLGQLTRAAVSAFQQQAQAKEIVLEVRTPQRVSVQGDGQRLNQVIRNLVSNAITHSPQGGRVMVSSELGDGTGRIVVQDTGPGIPAEDLPHIFERFYRVDKSRSRATGGTGLGLTIARRLVEAHGGEINVESEESQGARFIVDLPRAWTPQA